MQYTLKEKNEEKVLDSVIEISGLTSAIKPSALFQHLMTTKKVREEQLAQMEVNRQLNEKAVEVCPELKSIPEDKLALALSYFGKVAANKQSEDIVKECDDTINVYETHLREIEKVMEIEILPAKVEAFNPVDNG